MKHNNNDQEQWDESLLEGENAAYLEMLYEQFQDQPDSVSPKWRDWFEHYDSTLSTKHSLIRQQFRTSTGFHNNHCPQTGLSPEVLRKEREQVHLLAMIDSFRFVGHLVADTNPLQCFGTASEQKELTLEYHGLDKVDRERVFDPGSFNIKASPTLENIYKALRRTYTESLGVEYMHIMDTEEKRWLQRRLEFCESTPDFSAEKKKRILKKLIAAEDLERYLHTRYVGQKRFSLEGAETLIPMLDELIHRSGMEGVQEIALGMAHRGRLNVLVNTLGKPPKELFDEFAGVDDDPEHTGDVKYHKGYSNNIETAGGNVHVVLAFNPSHLEIITPVVAGSVRARQSRRDDHEGNQVLGVVIHGDAAFAGQGVVMETLNMAQTRGYGVRGTVHIVINNQIGFTTSTIQDSRSSYYATDVAKIVNAPILHVNGDDPEAVVFAAQVALEYRMRYRKDVVIDLVCYRRNGHNEADEPAVTQPIMYQEIRSKETARSKYVVQLLRQGVITDDWADAESGRYRQRLEIGDSVVNAQAEKRSKSLPAERWLPYFNTHWLMPAHTGYPLNQLKQLGERITQIPEDFVIHDRVKKIFAGRKDMLAGNRAIDWGLAENLAYASLLEEGYNIRLSGQDSGRGTFFHRHAVVHNQVRRAQWTPLQHLSQEQGKCEVIDSLLSEEAVLAFEYGFATSDPETLCIWEAQFGDFANGAQVVIDQFISSGEQKWGRYAGLVMLLPHGLEGMGPEHSSARLERYMQLCAQDNIQVCSPTTPAQIFHLLRRQMIRPYRKPLVIMSPKSLLRHPVAISSLGELVDGEFKLIIDDELPDREQVERVVLCSGKIYYDLIDERNHQKQTNVAIIRIEQLYPFPKQQLVDILEFYPNMKQLVWCQEEAINQGAWDSIKHRFRAYDYAEVYCVSRPIAAAPAVGTFREHQAQQRRVIDEALGNVINDDTSYTKPLKVVRNK
jgi:2-oxoglutarate dehydrogenase E1 component